MDDGLPIASLPASVRAYLAAFDLVAIAFRDGRLRATCDPAGAAAAWWLSASKAQAVLKRARKHGGDVQVAARALDVVATEHTVVTARAKTAVAPIEATLVEAQRRGDLKFFNAEYQRRRQAALADGRGFMSYRHAQARLRSALAAAVVAGVTADLVASVFGS